MEFPKFNGIGDPLPWLNLCERFFHVCRTPEDKRVDFTCSMTPSSSSTTWSSTVAA
jgi:hypothetical protein